MPPTSRNTKEWVVTETQIKTILSAAPFNIAFGSGELNFRRQFEFVSRDIFGVTETVETTRANFTSKNKTHHLIPVSEFIDQLNALGAGIVWDPENSELQFIVDRLGVKMMLIHQDKR